MSNLSTQDIQFVQTGSALALAAYGNPGAGSETIVLPSGNWVRVDDARLRNLGIDSGYQVRVYANEQTRQLWIANAGTNDFKDVAAWPSVLFGLAAGKAQFKDAIDAASIVKDLTKTNQPYDGYSIHTSGHSFGETLSQVQSYAFGISGVGFDGPGASAIVNSPEFRQLLAEIDFSPAGVGDFISVNIQGLLFLGGGLVGDAGTNISGTREFSMEHPGSIPSSIFNLVIPLLASTPAGAVITYILGRLLTGTALHGMDDINNAVQNGKFAEVLRNPNTGAQYIDYDNATLYFDPVTRTYQFSSSDPSGQAQATYSLRQDSDGNLVQEFRETRPGSNDPVQFLQGTSKPDGTILDMNAEYFVAPGFTEKYSGFNSNGVFDQHTMHVLENFFAPEDLGDIYNLNDINQRQDVEYLLYEQQRRGLADSRYWDSFTQQTVQQLINDLPGEWHNGWPPPQQRADNIPGEWHNGWNIDPIGAFYDSQSRDFDQAPSIARHTPVVVDADTLQGLSAEQLAHYDADGDGRISLEESASLRFWADLNEDGQRTGDEILAIDRHIFRTDYRFYTQGNANATPIRQEAPAAPTVVPHSVSNAPTLPAIIPGAVPPPAHNLVKPVKVNPIQPTYYNSYRMLRDTDNVYPVSGGLIQWAYNQIKIPYSHKTYLVGTDGNDNFDANYYSAYPHFFDNSLLVNFFAGGGDDVMGGSARDDNMWGGYGNDVLFGYAGNDHIWGEQGDDEIQGQDGNDYLDGGDGHDKLVGGNGNDILHGSNGNDILFGHMPSSISNDTWLWDADDDFLYGGSGNDILYGGPGNDYMDGGDDNDILHGETGNDVMFGGAGDDHLLGGFGDDFMLGESGNDIMFGQTGNDYMWGGDGDDFLYGGTYSDDPQGNMSIGETDNDFLYGEGGNDYLSGGAGNDYLDGGTGDDHLLGGDGDDILFGQAGNDELQGGAGNDQMSGGSGNDRLFGQVGDDRLWGGDGDDLLVGFTASNEAKQTLDPGETDDDILHGEGGNDTLLGGPGRDFLYGGSGNDVLDGGSGDDFLFGETGHDELYGGDGNDFLDGGSGNDILRGGAGDDALYGGDGNDELQGGGGNDLLYGEVGNDLLFGEDGDDYLDGGLGDDELQGGAGNDQLVGGSGNDRLFGQVGNDILWGGDGNDILVGFTATNDSKQTLAPGETDDDILYGGNGHDNLYGGLGNDILDGGSGNDILLGEAGNDTLYGGSGNDELQGGDGDDQLIGGDGDDKLFGQAGNDILWGGDGNDILVGFTAANEDKQTLAPGETDDDILYGGAGSDILIGGLGNDQLYGGSGRDELQGGDGNDILYGEEGDDNLFGQAGDDILYGGDGDDYLQGFTASNEAKQTLDPGETDNDYLYGGAGNDTLVGGPGDDYLDGGEGADIMIGGSGDDIYIVNSVNDIIYELEGEGYDTVITNTSYLLNAHIEELRLLEGFAIHGTGNAQDNLLIGNSHDNILDGVTGADTMIGGRGNDTYYVDNAGDVVVEYADEGEDTVQSSISYVLPEHVENLLLLDFSKTEKGLVDGREVLVYGYPKRNELDYMQGDAVENYLGTCALTSIANLLTQSGRPTSESEIVTLAIDNNWTLNNPELPAYQLGGTNVIDQRQILDSFGMRNDVIAGYNETGMANLLRSGRGLILAVNAGLLWEDHNYVGDGSVNHAITLTGAVHHADDGSLAGFYIADSGRGRVDDMTRFVSIDLMRAAADVPYAYSIYTVEPIKFWEEDIDGTGNELDNTLVGNRGNNVLMGMAGNDLLDGGAGADTMIGGSGDDTYVVDHAGDRVIELAGEGYDSVLSSISLTLAANTEALFLQGNEAINGTGNELDNVLVGNDADNVLKGMAGNDLIDGGAGADTMIGGSGDDTYIVDDVGDQVIELSNEGYDSVHSSISLTLAENVEALFLQGDEAIDGTGNDLDNTLAGNDADNVLKGMEGNDLLDGGAGADTMIGGSGDDTYIVDDVGDQVIELADEGYDTVHSSVSLTLAENVEALFLQGDEAIDGTGNDQDNTLVGNHADNVLKGMDGDDVLDGGAGNDFLDGGIGADTLIGGSGDDIYIVDDIDDRVIELADEGFDTVHSSISLTLAENVEALFLQGDEAIDGTGNDQDNTLVGNSADNVLKGMAGNDVLDGGAGADIMIGGSGDDTYIVDDIGDQVIELADEGYDTVLSSVSLTMAEHTEALFLQGIDAIDGTGNDLDNTLIGNSADNVLQGLAGNDLLKGLEGNDWLDGGAGADTMIGGSGDDTYIVDDIGDQVIELAGEGYDTVLSSVSLTLAEHTEALFLQGNEAIDGTGNDLDNTLVGNGADNILKGMAGNDLLQGLEGNDLLDGGTGADIMIGGNGDDTYIVDNVGDQVIELADEGFDSVHSSISYSLTAHTEALFLQGDKDTVGIGNELDNLIRGNAQRNALSGGDGNDILEGGAGDDVLWDNQGSNLFNGEDGDDHLEGGEQGSIYIGGKGNDTIVTGNGDDLLLFNSGDGQDQIRLGDTGHDTLSLGGDIRAESLRLSRTGDDLVLDVGSGDSLTFADWYTPRAFPPVMTLQVMNQALRDYAQQDEDPICEPIAHYDFSALVAAFDNIRAADAELTEWAPGAALEQHALAGPDDAAAGADFAWEYARHGSLSGMGLTSAFAGLAGAGLDGQWHKPGAQGDLGAGIRLL